MNLACCQGAGGLWTGLGWATPVGGQARIRSHGPPRLLGGAGRSTTTLRSFPPIRDPGPSTRSLLSRTWRWRARSKPSAMWSQHSKSR